MLIVKITWKKRIKALRLLSLIISVVTVIENNLQCKFMFDQGGEPHIDLGQEK
jgi:hypothetical protein